MGKFNKHGRDHGRFGKCQICLEYIPVEYYFGRGDEIICYECGTEYRIESKDPVKLTMIADSYGGDEFFDEHLFDNYS